MPIQKITGPDGSEMTGFVIVDLADAEGADGVVRCAKKILMDGARTMARSRTYSWALLEQRRSGASAAINVPPPGRSAGIESFVAEILPRVEGGELSLDAGKGVAPQELDSLDSIDSRSALRSHAAELTAAGIVAATSVALGGLEGRSVAIEGAGALGPRLLRELESVGARVTAIGTSTGTLADPAGLDPVATAASWEEHGDSLPAASDSELPADALFAQECDALLCGSKLGVIDHKVVSGLTTQVICPVGVAPVTAKALADATKRDIVVLPDFLTLSGGLHTFTAAADASIDSLRTTVDGSIRGLLTELLDHDEGPYLGACLTAEQFLATWQDDLPFGRPLA